MLHAAQNAKIESLTGRLAHVVVSSWVIAGMYTAKKECIIKSKVERTRNGGTWTEAQYWGHLRSNLRRAYRYWVPAKLALEAARRPVIGRGNQKWEYQCNTCKEWFPRKEVEADHVDPCGSLKCLEDIAPFFERLTQEPLDAFQCLCRECHKKKTYNERYGDDGTN